MAKYTTEVRYICEHYSGLTESVGANNVDKVISDSVDKIFNFNFPIFDENYRKVLESKILKHYYTREIGFETVGLWQLKLNTKLNEIMPYYNQLYKSELLEFNPFYDVDYTHTTKGSNNTKSDNTTKSDITDTGKFDMVSGTGTTENGTITGTTNRDTEKWDKYSDTPQGAITNIENDTYLTNARKNSDTETITGTNTTTNGATTEHTESNTTERTGTSETKGAGTINTTEDYIETIKGKQGVTSYTKLLKEFRETFLNIDMQVIDDLSELFLNLW